MNQSGQAVGLVETRGAVALAAGIEAMLKTADVEVAGIERISYGFFAVAVRGQLAAVRQALDSGSAAVAQYGELRAVRMYPRPDAVSLGLLENGSRAALATAAPQGTRSLESGGAG
ncbi:MULTISPECIES: BMC domain-containing protein [unclassified Streptomyces]|uniref:BMC domain-containing protein n=1 Tax=unclassified Streptomyces TaxID=2593676 RepID=UPI00136C9DA4|nr:MULTISPECIES: BMC domain-containing protein [unclassified Streptomyces]MCW5251302.1 BMC domain-containing protein [Streptomyces sp. SHP 1-2]MYU22644.1 BMC domain-containing protein [Streptomyces sp. SID8352]